MTENMAEYSDEFVLGQRAYWAKIYNSGTARERGIIRARFKDFETERVHRGLLLPPSESGK